MNPQQVQQMIQQEIHKNSQRSRFNLTNIPRHTHNDVDSPSVYQPTKTYAGSIGADGSIGLLPIGWSVTVNGTGDYTITHNISNALYSVIVSPAYNAAITNVSIFVQPSFGVTLFTSLSPKTPINTGFNFLMTVVNNKATKPTQYGGIATTN